jgi:hypothetical protein
MRSFRYFDLYDYLTVFIFMLIAVTISYFYIRRCNKKLSQQTNPNLSRLRRIGLVNLISGSVMGIGSLIGFIKIELLQDRFIWLIRYISIRKAEPYVIALIVFFIVGLVLISVGTNYLMKSRNSR